MGGARAATTPSEGRSTSEEALALERELRQALRGEVRFDDGSRALYATDGSNYRQLPIGVVLPRDAEEIIQTIAICRRLGVPILPRGGGTSLAGQCCNVTVVIDMSKYVKQLVALDPDRKLARVQPGLILDDLRSAAERHNLTFGPDPATHAWCTLGGMIGNNSCGVHSVMSGRTADNVEELEILTYDGLRMRVGATSENELDRIIREGGRRGQIYLDLKRLRDQYTTLIRQRYPKIPRRVSGYNLDELLPERGFNIARALVGSEGTCVTVLEATVRLVYSPPRRSLLVLAYPDIYAACDHVPQILSFRPVGLEGVDDLLVRFQRKKNMHPDALAMLPRGAGWLLVEFGGESQDEADERSRLLMDHLRRGSGAPNMRLFSDTREAKKIWEVRESGLGATAFVPGEPVTWEGWEDAAVPPEQLGSYLRQLHALMKRFGYYGALYGHFGEGCVHTRINFDFSTQEGVKKFRTFVEEAADLVVSLGGSLSGEHGDGQSRAELLGRMFGLELVQAFREFKTIWDPEGRMNPHKVVEPYRIDENLRLGPDYKFPVIATHFKFPEDNSSFAHAAMRCVGVGRCRSFGPMTMCPSYRVTHEEMHTTRGRAHLLFEMLRGGVKDGWRDEHVKEALDLCLSCKGCKGDCPVNVDLATYKAEFLAHYYEGRWQPRHAYAFGLIDFWAKMAAPVPWLANFFSQTPGLRGLMKFAAGMAPERTVPSFAAQTFRSWMRVRAPQNSGKPPLILWPDTFNNYFYPGTARAAVEVLEAAGFEVVIPKATLCCGRPLYDFGMLDRAKRLLQKTMDALEAEIVAGVPIVGLEPSCVAVFRDELPSLFPQDERAQRLSRQTLLFSEFLEQHAQNFALPQLRRKALVHGHCHHKALMKMDAEESVLRRLGLDFTMLESGCCGMAGSFGFVKEHYRVSKEIGELVLLPKVRAASPETLIVADGFSCREQIAQEAGRQTLHLAEAAHMALRNDGRVPG